MSDTAEIFRWETFSVSLISGIEKVWIRGGGVGVSRFSVENFLSDSAEIFRWETFSVSLISGIEKVWIRGGGGGSEYQDSPSNIFCLRVPKTFIEEPLCAAFQKSPASEKING